MSAAAPSNSILDAAIPFNAVRRNILIGSALAFLLLFTDVDASEFKFFEVRIGADTLLAVLAGFLGFYLLIFSFRLVLLFVASVVEGYEAKHARRKAEMDAIDQQRLGRLPPPIFSSLYQTIPQFVTAYVIAFEYFVPFAFGTLMWMRLSQRVDLFSFAAAAFR